MTFASKNMNYVFNHQYFDNLRRKVIVHKDGTKEEQFEIGKESEILERNRALEQFTFHTAMPTDEWDALPGCHRFSLWTLYPGTLIGTGNPHSMKMDHVIKCGFTFDYATGLPMLPGSSLKGILRSYFPQHADDAQKEEYTQYIGGLLQAITGTEIDLEAFETAVFDGGDVFLGAVPKLTANGSQLLQSEFLTPHNKGRFKNPVPINLIKIRPGVELVFYFLLQDYTSEDGQVIVSAQQKEKLFRQILLDMGIGAKTNVGFGKLTEAKWKPDTNERTDKKHKPDTNGKSDHAPTCADPACSNYVKINPKTGKYYKYCWKCSQKYNHTKRSK